MAESFYRNTSVQSQTAGQNKGAGVYNNRQSSETVGHRLGQRYSKVENKITGGDSEDNILSLSALPTIFRRLLSTIFNSFTICSTEKRNASTLTTLTVPRRMRMQRHSSSLATAQSPVKSMPSRYLKHFGFTKSARRTNVHKRRD
jgi:hypothetical protein